jgi:hypothetical protein
LPEGAVTATNEDNLDSSYDASYASSMSTVAPLIEEAWEHRRRRRRAAGITAFVAAVIAAAALVIIAGGSGSVTDGRSGPTPSPSSVVAPSRVLSKAPYMGVRCPVANSTACDRVGLAVWLKRPAISVTARIAGAKLSLHNPDQSHGAAEPPSRTLYGYLHPAGIVSRLRVRPVKGNIVGSHHDKAYVTVAHQMWFGEHQPSPAVRLTIHYRAGQTVVTQLRVPLSPGWG